MTVDRVPKVFEDEIVVNVLSISDVMQVESQLLIPA